MGKEVWWLYICDVAPEHGEPSLAAFSTGNAYQFETLGSAVAATAAVPTGKYPWIYGGDGVLFAPDQIKPIRKLLYKPEC